MSPCPASSSSHSASSRRLLSASLDQFISLTLLFCRDLAMDPRGRALPVAGCLADPPLLAPADPTISPPLSSSRRTAVAPLLPLLRGRGQRQVPPDPLPALTTPLDRTRLGHLPFARSGPAAPLFRSRGPARLLTPPTASSSTNGLKPMGVRPEPSSLLAQQFNQIQPVSVFFQIYDFSFIQRFTVLQKNPPCSCI